MKAQELLRVMRNERACILRARKLNCNQSHCAECDLVLPEDVIINAYDVVIDILEGMNDDLK